MSNINYAILKFLNKDEKDFSPLIECPIYKVYLNKSNKSDDDTLFYEDTSFNSTLLNKYISLILSTLPVDNVIVIREGMILTRDSIINLITPFEKYPRLGICYPQIYEEYEGFPREYYSAYELSYNCYIPPNTSTYETDYDIFSPLFRGLVFSISRNTFETVGLFNEKYLTEYCYIDYSIRCTKERIRIACSSKSEALNSLNTTDNWTNSLDADTLEKDVILLEETHGNNISIFNKIQHKTIVECQIFNQDHLLEAWLKNVNEFVDEIIILYSKEPWGHNPSAIDMFKPDSSGEILEKYKKIYSKLTVIEGDWKDETYERNLGLYKAIEMGGKYLVIIDADEFYEKDEIFKAFDYMVDNPTEIYVMNTIQMVKKINWAAFPEEGYPLCNFAIDLTSPVRFLATRIVGGESILIPFEVCKCYHLSYLLPKEKLEQKLLTSYHYIEFLSGWYENVWPYINLNSKNFHPTHPNSWSYMMDIKLPYSIIKDIDYLKSPEFI